MINFQHDESAVQFTAPAPGVTSGTPVLIGGNLLVVPAVTAVTGALFNGLYRGLFTVVKAAGQTWTEGQAIYWDDTAKNFTTTAAGNFLAGVAQEAALLAATAGHVLLLPGVGMGEIIT